MTTSPGGNLGDLVDRSGDPAAVAVIDLADPGAPTVWTHGRLDAAAGAVARELLARGHRRGDRIALASSNRAEYLAAFLGILRAGMVAVPLNWKLPRATLELVLDDAGVSLVFADAERRAACPPGIAAAHLR